MGAEMSSRYKYVSKLADSARDRAKVFHLAYQREEDEKVKASLLNDYFYWIGHANAYRGIALQLDFMETVEMDEDEEAKCP